MDDGSNYKKELEEALSHITTIQDKALDQARIEYDKDNIDGYYKYMDIFNKVHPIAYHIYTSIRYIVTSF